MKIPAKVVRKVDAHFEADDKAKWDRFAKALRSKKFVEALQADPRADDTLKRFALAVHRRQTDRGWSSKVLGDAKKTYTVKFHPNEQRYSCTCKDWTYVRSHAGGDCKHIKSLRGDDLFKQADLMSAAERVEAVRAILRSRT